MRSSEIIKNFLLNCDVDFIHILLVFKPISIIIELSSESYEDNPIYK